MRIAIVGAGIAGPTLAYWLHRYGYVPTLIEKTPHLRTGGYVVDFWGGGYTVADRMGLTAELETAGYAIDEVRLVDRNGRRTGGFSADVFRRNLRGGFISVPRGDLAAMIFRSLDTGVETLLGQSISGIHQDDSGVQLTFADGRSRDFELLIGAGGIHSPVRDLVFGPQAGFERDLGYRVAAFEVEGYQPRDQLVYLAYTLPGRMVARFSMRGDRTLFLFVFTQEHLAGPDPQNVEEAKSALWRVFGGTGWECPQILQSLDRAPDLYFDRVSQIVMPSWSKGRVALIGDAAGAVSLLAGQGAALAMVEAYVLAGELTRADDDYAQAFRRYERRLRPLVEERQRSARTFASMFAPKTTLGLWVRNQASKLLNTPYVADKIIGSEFGEEIELPDYAVRH